MAGSPDRPIRSTRDDVLGRGEFADGLADQLVEISHGGSVTALTGPWGTGKTSLLNLVQLELENRDVPVVKFNPWLFSGTDELIERFFEALLAELGATPGGSNVRERLRRYADAVTPLGPLPVLGPWLQRAALATKALTALGVQGGTRDVAHRRQELDAALAEVGTPIVVLLDDIDRLAANEVAAVLRLVRLVADFPNVAYLLAFDEQRVHSALRAHGEPEPERYLEKIVQVVHVLPPARESDIALQLARGFDRLLAQYPAPTTLPDTHRVDVHNLVIRPLMTSMRSVRRYLIGLPLTLRLVGNEVAAIDACALEAIRLFAPNVHQLISGSAEALANAPRANAARAATKCRLVEVDKAAVSAGIAPMLQLLFPAGRLLLDGAEDPDPIQIAAWREQHRVADRIVLDTFLLRALPPGVTPALDLQALIEATEPAAIQAAFEVMPAEALPDAFRRLPALLPAVDVALLGGVLEALTGPVRRRWMAEALYFAETDDVLDRAVAAIVSGHQIDERVEDALVGVITQADPDDAAWLLRLLGEDPVWGQYVLTPEAIERVAARTGEAT